MENIDDLADNEKAIKYAKLESDYMWHIINSIFEKAGSILDGNDFFVIGYALLDCIGFYSKILYDLKSESGIYEDFVEKMTKYLPTIIHRMKMVEMLEMAIHYKDRKDLH